MLNVPAMRHSLRMVVGEVKVCTNDTGEWCDVMSLLRAIPRRPIQSGALRGRRQERVKS